MTIPDSLEGRRWEGQFTLQRWMAYLWAEATQNGAASRDSAGGDGAVAPPTLALIVAREAAGTTTIEEELGRDDRDGTEVFLGGQRITFDQPLRIGQSYRGVAEVISRDEKAGESGTFTLVTVAYTVETAAGTSAFQMETDFVVKS